MKHLIDKDAVLAEIDKRISLYQDKDNFDSYTRNALMCLKKDIDTLEVKEVDLDKPFEGIKVQTSMESGSLDEVIVTTRYKAQKGEKV